MTSAAWSEMGRICLGQVGSSKSFVSLETLSIPSAQATVMDPLERRAGIASSRWEGGEGMPGIHLGQNER